MLEIVDVLFTEKEIHIFCQKVSSDIFKGKNEFSGKKMLEVVDVLIAEKKIQFLFFIFFIAKMPP